MNLYIDPDTGTNLRKLRFKKGMSQAELARRVGTSRVTLNRIEKGSRNPSARMLLKLLDVLGYAIRITFVKKIKLHR